MRGESNKNIYGKWKNCSRLWAGCYVTVAWRWDVWTASPCNNTKLQLDRGKKCSLNRRSKCFCNMLPPIAFIIACDTVQSSSKSLLLSLHPITSRASFHCMSRRFLISNLVWHLAPGEIPHNPVGYADEATHIFVNYCSGLEKRRRGWKEGKEYRACGIPRGAPILL